MSIQPSQTFREYALDALGIMSKHSLYADKADWEKEKTNLPALQSYQEARDYLSTMLKKLHDTHGQIQPAEFTGQMLDGSIDYELPTGYMKGNMAFLKIPTFFPAPGTQSVTFAKTANDLVERLLHNTPAAWSIDLRGNFGGTPSAMLLAVRHFLPEGELLHFRHKEGGLVTWSLKNAAIYKEGEKIDEIAGLEPITKIFNAKVFILVDEVTRSAAEFTAIALKSHPEAEIMGEKTFGYTTGIHWHKLPNGDSLFITDSIVLDKQKNPPSRPDGKLEPDRRLDWRYQDFF